MHSSFYELSLQSHRVLGPLRSILLKNEVLELERWVIKAWLHKNKIKVFQLASQSSFHDLSFQCIWLLERVRLWFNHKMIVLIIRRLTVESKALQVEKPLAVFFQLGLY